MRTGRWLAALLALMLIPAAAAGEAAGVSASGETEGAATALISFLGDCSIGDTMQHET